MSRKHNQWIFTMGVFLLSILLLTMIPAYKVLASAGTTTSNSCFTCHEDLYYLHDLGKGYCLSEQTDRCVNCHEGNPGTMIKDASHTGLIAHPQKENGAKCQECHQEDSQERLISFASLAGYKPIVESISYVPSTNVEEGFPGEIQANTAVENLPIAALAILLFLLWLVLVLSSPQKP